MAYFLGIDFGTSGARAILIDDRAQICFQGAFPFGSTTGSALLTLWQTTLLALLAQLPAQARRSLAAIAINGTSSTVFLCNPLGEPVTEPLLYNDNRSQVVLPSLRTIAPPDHLVISATSSLAKLLWWQHQGILLSEKLWFTHQADWLAFLLHGQLGISDYHNALKLGYDVEQLCYPAWLLALDLPVHLPRVVAPGAVIGPLRMDLAQQFQISADCQVCAGTTDSIAAFLASGACLPGEAVTSLGSTLVLKLLSPTRVDDARYGLYSHRLGKQWLVGGASNTGGAVLRHFFSDAQISQWSQQINGAIASPYDYYPLIQPGERFPINDPHLLPRLEPRPADPIAFLHGLLEGIARIEALGYQRLQELGAPALRCVYTAGGGAQNSTWGQIRHRHLGVPLPPMVCTEAAYGTALLAMGKGHRELV